MEITDIYGYLRINAGELGTRILEMYPPLQRTTDQIPGELSTLLRDPLRGQAIAIGGLAKHFRSSRAARIVAECGAGKTYMALGLAHVLKARTILVMCPSHLGKKWAREAIHTIPFVRTFLIEDMRNGEDPRQPQEFLKYACARAVLFTKGCNCRWRNFGAWAVKAGCSAFPGVRCSSFRRIRESPRTSDVMHF